MRVREYSPRPSATDLFRLRCVIPARARHGHWVNCPHRWGVPQPRSAAPGCVGTRGGNKKIAQTGAVTRDAIQGSCRCSDKGHGQKARPPARQPSILLPWKSAGAEASLKCWAVAGCRSPDPESARASRHGSGRHGSAVLPSRCALASREGLSTNNRVSAASHTPARAVKAEAGKLRWCVAARLIGCRSNTHQKLLYFRNFLLPN